MEYFELLSENGQRLGKLKEREAVHRDGDLHGGSHIWVIRRTKEGAVEVLLQRRRADKDSFPGCLDVSCAGHMTAGEDFLSTARRELREELGLSVREEDLIFLHDQRVGGEYAFHGRPFRNYEINYVYLLRLDFPLDGLRYQEEEIAGLCWQEIGQIRESLKDGSRQYCIHASELKELYRYCVEKLGMPDGERWEDGF